ncbi:phytoene synthase [Candidatus Saccharibacteria bacterium]|nr:MAG: phytoene synthase [Candidatus Saccharibacteria bacterium]
MASRLFDASVRPHIYAIYGMVRLADEIVDTYQGKDARQRLDAFEREVMQACKSGYSTNPLLYAFGLSAREYDIDAQLIAPFFASMRSDIKKTSYTARQYADYIYGSAEVVGLMCLKVFVGGDEVAYERLAPGARALGSAYQKVNFLRDVADDYHGRGRMYFPGVTFARFDDAAKRAIEADIRAEFDRAKPAIEQLPRTARRAVMTSYLYYRRLLARIEAAPADTIKSRRMRVPTLEKLALLGRAVVL